MRRRRRHRRGLRTKCIVSVCRRSYPTPAGGGMILCRRCWKLADPALREDFKAAKKAFRDHLRRARAAGWRHYRGWFPPEPLRFMAPGDGRLPADSLALTALNCEEACAWLAVVKDAEIKRRFGVRL